MLAGMLTVAVLGPVEVRRDGVPLAVPAGKTTEVLIRLALDAGELVRTDRLIDDLWSGQSAASPATRCRRRCRSCAGPWASRGC